MSTKWRVATAGCAIGTLVLVAPLHAAETKGAQSGDDAMTCEQIATELAPYGQQFMPSLQAYMASQSQLLAQSQAMGQQRAVESAMLLPLAEAGALDPTGMSKRAYQLAVMAQYAKQKAESEALLNSPLAKQNKAQGEQMAAQAQQLQQNERLQHLMQLAQQKHCDKK